MSFVEYTFLSKHIRFKDSGQYVMKGENDSTGKQGGKPDRQNLPTKAKYDVTLAIFNVTLTKINLVSRIKPSIYTVTKWNHE